MKVKTRIGSICKRHPELMGERLLSYHCRSCLNENNKAWIDKNRERHRASRRENYWRNIEKFKKKRMANKEYHAAFQKKWNSMNPEKRYQLTKDWKERNLTRFRALQLNNQTKRDRLIAGQKLSETYREEIIEIYESCPVGFQVDHIIPLQGENVTGLHVPWNLQYLTPYENKSKGNRVIS